MNEFLLIFRKDHDIDTTLSPSEMQDTIKPWLHWLKGLEEKGCLLDGKRLESAGAVIKPGKVVTNGPYAEIKEAIGGIIVVKAADIAAALEIGKGCPVLDAPWYGTVEVRQLMQENGH